MISRIIKDIINRIRYLYIRRLTVEQKFSYFYRNNIFEGKESISGEGSSLDQTIKIRKELTKLFSSLKIKSIIDAPCGDLNWIKHLELSEINYLGIDVVQDIITENRELFSNNNRSFICADLINYVPPKADLILCRDCLVHLSYTDIKKIIRNFKKSGSKYLLTTTFANHKENIDLNNAIWRTLNLEQKPFSFSKPLKLINEGCTEMNNQYTDKSLGLWKLADL